MTGFDWPALMQAGLKRQSMGGLGLDPALFWSLTPAELSLMLGHDSFRPPMGRARLDELLAQYPDNIKGEIK